MIGRGAPTSPFLPDVASPVVAAPTTLDSLLGPDTRAPAAAGPPPPPTHAAAAPAPAGAPAASASRTASLAASSGAPIACPATPAPADAPAAAGAAVGAPPAAAPAAAGAAAAPLDLSDMRRFVSSPLPRSAGVLRCVVERDAAGLAKRMFPAYTLRGDGAWAGGSGGGGGRALLAARKRTASVTANYVISLDARDLGRGSPATVGKVRANYLGTEFTVFDDGVAPGKADGGGGACRRELAAVLFTSNVLSSRGPRKMRAAVPRLSADDTPAVVLQPARDADGMAERMQDAARAGDLLLMVNREPSWNDDLGAYVLNFDGRVTQPSVKNFQLVEAAGGAAAGAAGGAGLPRVLLLFGRVDRDRFTLDFQGPLSPLQAFAIALTSLDYKLGCE